MGVQGLSGFLKRVGLDKNDATATTLPPESTTLAIDGNGLIFHLFRLAYYRHRRNISSSSPPDNDRRSTSLRAQLLLPSFVPLSLADDVTTAYLSQLTAKHGMHLRIYFDGPDQHMKSREKKLRRERREDEWENARQLCLHGIMPESGESKFRSSARRQSREHERRRSSCLDNGGDGATNDNADANSNDDSEVEMYLTSFPYSPLVMDQIERSIWAFADTMGSVLPSGSVQVMQCEGEADVEVARASAEDATGATYSLAKDSDYLIYGYDSNIDNAGETRYLRFEQIDPKMETLSVGNVLTRSNVAGGLGLPSPKATVELSILLGNDYTGPFLRHEDRQKGMEYWDSLKWHRDGDGDKIESEDSESMPPKDELDRFDAQEVADHVGEKVGGGMRLSSSNKELSLAIEFSYRLYSFGDIRGFPTVALGSTTEEDENREEEDAIFFPSLPPGFDISLARGSSGGTNLCESALLPLISYMSDTSIENNGMDYVEQRHLDAFRMTLQRTMAQNWFEIELPRRVMRWIDLQALYILERCLLEAIGEGADPTENMPRRVFDRSIFHSCLESLSFEDDPLDNELVSNKERAFLEEVADELPGIGEKKEEKEGPAKMLVLPIDEHKEEILHTIQTQRVTIIHGETGCGKSSRVPCFLLRADPPEPTRTAPEVKMIVSQPRRIAAKALAERVRSCEPDIASKIGLRMGHGIREYETKNTRAWFVTTGYVVRLLANHPSWFDSHTHLIIDEVHERSVDTDILCLLCRRLLQSHPTIRLVLMSATMAAELYSQYFGAPQPPIHVGARRFPIREAFVEDLRSLLALSSKSAKIAQDVYNSCEKTKCSAAPSAQNMEKLYRLATEITASVGSHGSSVLIFVPGMNDIEAIVEMIERLNVNDATFICLPIHSDIPFEDQMAAFEPPKEGEVKVIIATNAAESSLTLPDVDHVICLGLCKQIIYNRASHRQMLVPTWISRASATQRAGRTGRVRPGNVYRLYSRNTFQSYMQPFDEGELVRTPLDSTILSLREMLNEAVTPILLDCLEPPDVSNIERSFESLHASNFISDPSDEGQITSLGSLVVALGIDLTLGALVGLGIQFGVAPEAIQLAAILSFPQSPWARSSPMYHDIDTFNSIISKTFTSRCVFDVGLFSEPLGIANLLHEYSKCRDRSQFCWKHCVSASRMRHLSGTVESLKRRVAECLSIRAEALDVEQPPRSMSRAKVNVLRILQTWLFFDTLIVRDPSKNKVESVNGSISIPLDGPPIGREHLLQVLDADRHPFKIINGGKSVVQGSFGPEHLLSENGVDYFQSLDMRFVSYALEKNVNLSFYFFGTTLKLFIPVDIWERPESAQLRECITGKISVVAREVSFLQASEGGNQRGRRGRACGTWHPLFAGSSSGRDTSRRVVILSGQITKSQAKEFKRGVDVEKITSVQSILSCNITQSKKKVAFSMTFSGECHGISNTDLGDLFAAPDVTCSIPSSTLKQRVNFSLVESNASEDDSSNNCLLIEDSPEGARLLSVLASERRRDNFIRFSDGADEMNHDELKFLDVNLPKAFSINGKRWKRKDGGGMVFVPENCVPVAAMPADNSKELFCCCANTLDLRGGACRVEGITMLPRGRLFVGLALLCFGVNPKTSAPIDSLDVDDFAEEKKEAGELSQFVRDALSWIYEKGSIPYFQQEQARVVEALDFHTSCMELGETLECQPNKIRALCALFDGVDGHPMTVWEGYDLSLKASMAAMRPQTIRQATSRRSNKTVNIDQERTHEAIVDKLMVISNNHEEHPDPSKPRATKTRTKHQTSTKLEFACLGCEELFPTWGAVLHHREQCCPGTRFHRKKSIALANDIRANNHGANDSSTERDKAPGKKSGKPMNEKTKVKQSDEPQNGSNVYDDSKSKTSKRSFACFKCRDLFLKWSTLLLHREKCCPGTRFNMKKSIALANDLGASHLDATDDWSSDRKGENGEATAKKSLQPKDDEEKMEQSHQPQSGSNGSKTMWQCQSCKETFGKRKLCDKHIKKCSFGLVKQTIPKLVYVCIGCGEMFETAKKCGSHMKRCGKESPVASGSNKARKENA